MITPQDWLRLVEGCQQFYYYKDGDVGRAPMQWYRTLRYSDEFGFTCGTGSDIVNLRDMYLTEEDCLMAEITKIQTKRNRKVETK